MTQQPWQVETVQDVGEDAHAAFFIGEPEAEHAVYIMHSIPHKRNATTAVPLVCLAA